MRRDTQGHVATPTRRDVTYALFIFIINIGVILHISIPNIKIMLTLYFSTRYKPDRVP